MRRRQLFALQTLLHDAPPEQYARAAAAVLQTEMAPSAIMMLSEADSLSEGGDVVSSPLDKPSAAGRDPQSPGGAPCPKCGKALGRRGRHFHLRKCNG